MSSSKILVSVIIGTYNRRHWLSKNFQALAKQKVSHEIILVDDSSTDGTTDFVKKKFPYVKVINISENAGFANAINYGFKSAKGKYLFIENPDMEVSENYLSDLVTFLEKNKKFAAVQGAIYNYENREKILTTGLLFHPLGILVSATGSQKKVSQINEILAGDALLVRSEAFLKVGGYDKACRLYYEDVDFGWRLWLAGYRICCLSSTKLYHKGNPLMSASTFAYTLKHNIYTSIKNLESLNAFLAVFVRIVLSSFEMLMFLLRGQFNYVIATGKAWVWVVFHLPMILKKRKQIQSSRKISDKNLNSEVGGKITLQYLQQIVPVIFKRY